jgi:nitroreductase
MNNQKFTWNPILLGVLGICLVLYFRTVGNASCFSSLLEKRFSGYAYDANKSVTDEQLKIIMQAGQLAPSSYNEQPWRFIICKKDTHADAYNKVLQALVPANQKWAQNAPVLIVIIADTKSAHMPVNVLAAYDTGAAAFAMALAATELGLVTHQMGGFNPEMIRAAFSISSDYVPMAVMALGWPDATRKEVRKKERRPLEQNFFMGMWQEA